MAIRLPKFQISVWLHGVAQRVAAQARILTLGKSGTAQGKTKISVRLVSPKKASVTASNFHAGRPPFDTTLDVPVGGFVPTRGKKAFRMIKPEGRVVYRSRIYTRFSGQKITRKGFLSTSFRNVMTGGVGRRDLQKLARLLAVFLTNEVANEIVAKMLANGVKAVRLTF